MRGNMLAGIPRATQLRARELAIPSAAAAAVSQMLATTARLGGRAYIPWSPAIGPSVFGNSDGSGGVPGVGGAVGLLLDSSNGWGFASGELVVNGNFSDGGTGWTPGVGWTISGGQVNANTAGSTSLVSAAMAGVTVGRSYLVQFTATVTSGNVSCFLGGVSAIPNFSSGNITRIVVAGGANQTISFDALNPLVCSIDNISVREVTSTVATALTQSTGINKPLLASGAVPWAGALVFDGNDFLTRSGSGVQTSPHWAVSAAIGQGSGLRSLMSLGLANGSARMCQMGLLTDGKPFSYYATDANVPLLITGAAAVPAGVFNVQDTVCDGTTSTLSLNGAVVASGAVPAGALTTTLSGVGCAFNSSTEAFNGQIAFAAYGFSAITASDIAVIRRGAAAIAGLAI
jgi:hypothetical protein